MTHARKLLQQYGLQPRKKQSQHFLTSESALARIVAAAELTPQETALEIGAGLGALTAVLAEAAAQVVAVEIDRRLVEVLQIELGHLENVRFVQGDILALDPAELMGEEEYKVVANLPYAITSAVLRHLLEASHPPRRMVVMVQREVAERIVARDGRMSLLAIGVHFYGRPQLLFRLRRGAFYPPPEVESAVLRIDRHDEPPVQVENRAEFFRLVRAGFSQPRKQLRNSLAAGLHLPPQTVAQALQAAGLDPRLRAERLRLEDWERLMHTL